MGLALFTSNAIQILGADSAANENCAIIHRFLEIKSMKVSRRIEDLRCAHEGKLLAEPGRNPEVPVVSRQGKLERGAWESEGKHMRRPGLGMVKDPAVLAAGYMCARNGRRDGGRGRVERCVRVY